MTTAGSTDCFNKMSLVSGLWTMVMGGGASKSSSKKGLKGKFIFVNKNWNHKPERFSNVHKNCILWKICKHFEISLYQSKCILHFFRKPLNYICCPRISGFEVWLPTHFQVNRVEEHAYFRTNQGFLCVIKLCWVKTPYLTKTCRRREGLERGVLGDLRLFLLHWSFGLSTRSNVLLSFIMAGPLRLRFHQINFS